MKLLILLTVILGTTWANECVNIAADEMCANMAKMGECDNQFSVEYCALTCGSCKAGTRELMTVAHNFDFLLRPSF